MIYCGILCDGITNLYLIVTENLNNIGACEALMQWQQWNKDGQKDG